MPFKDTNIALGVPKDSQFKAGRNNVDNGRVVEQGIGIPWNSDPAASWLYYDCTIGVMLDSGIVVHNRLPQVNRVPDTLASCNLDDVNLDTIKTLGVNLTSRDQYADIVQRMGHSRYWFRIWGEALRAGYRIAIPGIKTIGGAVAIPYDKNPQWAFNKIAPGANYGGVIVWHAKWSLWYTTATPPINQTIPAANPYAHISGNSTPPTLIQAPYGTVDDNAKPSGPTVTLPTLTQQ